MSEAATTTSVVKQSKATEVKEFIEKNTASIQAVLPRVGLTPEALTRTALSQIYKNPLLLECDKVSLMRAIIEAATLGLSFSLGRAYLVPFNNKVKKPDGSTTWRKEAQLMPGYLGLADIARRSGEISSISAQVVYKGDEFNYEFGLTEDRLHHKPLADPDDKNLTHAYAIVRFKDGGYQLVVMTRSQIDAVRRSSKSADSGPWVTWYAEMAKKTVLKRVLKLCPASIDMIRALDLDTAVEMGERPSLSAELFDDDTAIDVSAEEAPVSKTESVKNALKKVRDVGSDVAATAAASEDERAELLGIVAAEWQAIFKRQADADIEVSAATGGKVQSLDALEREGSVTQIKQVVNHLRIIASEDRKR